MFSKRRKIGYASAVLALLLVVFATGMVAAQEPGSAREGPVPLGLELQLEEGVTAQRPETESRPFDGMADLREPASLEAGAAAPASYELTLAEPYTLTLAAEASLEEPLVALQALTDAEAQTTIDGSDGIPIQPITNSQTQTTDAGDDVCPVSNVVGAFKGIQEKGGTPLAVSYWHGDSIFKGIDPTHCQHYQGIGRKDVNGIPYFFWMRSGNMTSSCCTFGWWKNEFLVTQIGSKINKEGERLGSCDSMDNGKCIPNITPDPNGKKKEDWVVESISIPGWMHLGGSQLIGDVLVVPAEEECECLRDNGECGLIRQDNKTCDLPEDYTLCTWDKIDNWTDYGALVFMDVTNPITPKRLQEIRQYNIDITPPITPTMKNFPGIGVVAVAKNPFADPPYSNYLFFVGGADFNDEEDYYFLTSDTDDLSNPGLLSLRYIWNISELGNVDCDPGWMKWQMVNFINSSDGKLYLIGTDNETIAEGGEDRANLFLVTKEGDNYVITCKTDKHLYSDESTVVEVSDMGDFDAVGGTYVSPTGNLILYMGPHDNNWRSDGYKDDNCSDPIEGSHRCYALQFGEFVSELYDNAPPVTTHDINGTLGDNKWYKSNVQVSLSTSDTCGSGVAQTQYRLNGGTWQTYTEPFSLTNDGVYSLEYQSKDIKNNWEAVKKAYIRIDTQRPNGSIRLNKDSSTTSSAVVRIDLPASDATSGVWQMRLRNAGEDWSDWQKYSATVFWSLPKVTGEGYTVEVMYRDWAGNESIVYTDNIFLDIYPQQPASSNYRLRKSTLGAGGGSGSSTGYRLLSTLGQPAMIGDAVSDGYRLSSGYWAKTNAAIALDSSPNPSAWREAVTFRAALSAYPPSALPPTGGVRFLDNGLPISGCANASLASGQAVCNTTTLAIGPHTITAEYSGDVNFNSKSAQISQQVDYHVDPDNLDVWSPNTGNTTPPCGTDFLGEFGNGPVTLSLAGLTAHTLATVDFDLFIIRSWNGSQVLWPPTSNFKVGPDIWGLNADGKELLRTTFSNWLEHRQAYPGWYPGGDYPRFTGAAEKNSLCYTSAGKSMDATYKLSFTFPHTGASLQLDFYAQGLEVLSNESWGLGNLKVSLMNATHTLYLPLTIR